MNKPELNIKIFSDIVCPWCYIGKRRLSKALDLVKDQYQVVLAWQPFELNPDMPEEGADRKEYRIRKFGSEERSKELAAQVVAVAQQEGLAFNMDKIERIPNTFAAHRLLRYAFAEGRQEQVIEVLFRKYFVEGRDVGQQSELLDAAVEGGLNRVATETFLNAEDDIELLRLDEEKGLSLGVNGVPFYVINDTYGISGAQAPEAFVRAFAEAMAVAEALNK
jgi:predicted DsbA family dithiol-disulfide isomerase